MTITIQYRFTNTMSHKHNIELKLTLFSQVNHTWFIEPNLVNLSGYIIYFF